MMVQTNTNFIKNKYIYSIRQSDSITLIGQSVKLTKQKTTNIKISTQFWQTFNVNLKKSKLTQGGNWVKYAVMERKGNALFYYCAIPKQTTVPDGFEVKSLAEHTYLVVEHAGAMNKIYDTYTIIYQYLLPELNIKPVSDDFLHFERYDYRFHWNEDNSIIEIWVPIQ